MMQRQTSEPPRSVRLVVETDDPALMISDFACFREAGFDVVVCGGPDPSRVCPAVEGEVCRDIAEADVVFNAFRHLDTQLAVANGVHRTSDTPVVVSATPGMTAQLPPGCIRVTRTESVNGQIDAARRAACASNNRTHSQ
jgi:hypothetical protein